MTSYSALSPVSAGVFTLLNVAALYYSCKLPHA